MSGGLLSVWDPILRHYYVPRRVALKDVPPLNAYPLVWLYCESRGCIDAEETVFISLEILHELIAYFGEDIDTAMEALKRRAECEWFTHEKAFLQMCEGRATSYQREPIYGICFGSRAPSYVVLSWTQDTGVVREEVPQGKSLEEIVKSKKDEGLFIYDPAYAWAKHAAHFEMELRLKKEAEAFVEGKDVPACPTLEKMVEGEENKSHLASNVLHEQGQKPLHQLFSGLGYRLVRELTAIYPDRKDVEWSRVWQWALSLPTHNSFAKEQKEIIFKTVVTLFTETAKPFAERIIDESFLHESERLIKPDSRFGGIAGGKKFVQGSQLFKFAQDVCLHGDTWIYGGSQPNHRLGMKSASHELKSTQALIDAGISQLNYPLMTVFTYRGKRVMCSSLLPVNGNETLRQGKGNIKDKMRVPPPEIESVMTMMGTNLFIGKSRKPTGEEIYGPFDMEIHLGQDGLLYMIDAARLFPPEYRGIPMGSRKFYQLLRPELLRVAGKFVLPDAVLVNDEEGLKDLVYVTKVLDDQIAQLVRELNQGLIEVELSSRAAVKSLLHSRGINMRHLQRLLDGLTEDCPARANLHFAMNFRAPMEEMQVKELAFPRELTEIDVRRILEIQDAYLVGNNKLQMIPRLLQLARLTKSPPLILESSVDRLYAKRIGGDHPLAHAFEICERFDANFKREYVTIKSCSYWTLCVLYEILRLDLGLSYPSRSSLEELVLVDHDRSPAFQNFRRFLASGPEDDIQSGMRLAAQDSVWSLVDEWARKHGAWGVACKVAAEFGNAQSLRALLAQHDADLAILMATAIQGSHIALCELLLEMKADVNARNSRRDPMIVLAAERSTYEVVQLLANRNAFIDAPSASGRTALMVAAKLGDVSLLSLLLHHGACVNSISIDGDSPVLIASQNGDLCAVRVLLEAKGDANVASHKGKTPLMLSARNGHREVANLLLMERADVNVWDKSGYQHWNPLMHASWHDRGEMVELLLENNADPNSSNANGLTALMLAAGGGHQDICEILLRRSAQVNVVTSDNGHSILHFASGHAASLVQLLIDHRAHVNCKSVDGSGYTPLMNAVRQRRDDTALCLINNRGDVNAVTDNDGFSPLMIASKNGDLTLVELLLDHGADISAKTIDDHWTPLVYAVRNGNLELVQLLLARGSTINQLSSGHSPLIWAIIDGHADIFFLLLSHSLNDSAVNDEFCSLCGKFFQSAELSFCIHKEPWHSNIFLCNLQCFLSCFSLKCLQHWGCCGIIMQSQQWCPRNSAHTPFGVSEAYKRLIPFIVAAQKGRIEIVKHFLDLIGPGREELATVLSLSRKSSQVPEEVASIIEQALPTVPPRRRVSVDFLSYVSFFHLSLLAGSLSALVAWLLI